MSRVIPFSPTQAAELVTPDAKRLSTAKARACLAGVILVERVAADGSTHYLLGMRRARSLDEAEELLDQLQGAANGP